MSNNVKPNEIIFLDFIDGCDENVYISDYWKFNYGIDANKTINRLINLGYLTFKSDVTKNVFKSTIPQLKEVLKENDLKVTGKKQELAERVLGNIDTDYLERKFNKKLFSLTFAGEQLIKNNNLYIINKKKNYMLTNKEIKDAYMLGDEYSDSDRLWSILNKRNITFPSQKKWSSYRSNLLNIGELLFQENKYEQSLQFYVAVFIIDLSGLTEDNYVNDIDSLFVARGIIKSIKSLISLCEYKTEDVMNLISGNVFCSVLPFRYYSNSTLVKILLDCLNDIEFSHKRYPHNTPSKNNPKYTYYGFYEDNQFDSEILENTITINSSSLKKKSFLSSFFELFMK